MTNFLLGFGPEYCIQKKFTIDVKKYKKRSELTPLIKSELNNLNIKEKFKIINENLDDLSRLKDNYVFQIKFESPQKDIFFQHQDGKKTEVKGASEKDVFYVIERLFGKKNDKKIFLNYTFDFNGIEIPKEKEKPFSNFPPGININVKIITNTISLKHEGTEFIFCEKEKTSFVTNFFRNFYNICDLNVIIFNGRNIKTANYLRKGDIINSMNFFQIVSGDENDDDDSVNVRYIQIDFHDTILQLKTKMASIFSEEKRIKLNEKDIILQQNKKELNDLNKKVRDINQNDGMISFQINVSNEKMKGDQSKKTKKIRKTKPKKKNSKTIEKTKEEKPKKEETKKTIENPKLSKEETKKTIENPKPSKEETKIKIEKPKPTKESNQQEKDEDNEKQEKEKKFQQKKSIKRIVPKVIDQELTIHFLFESANKKELQYTLSPDTTIKEIASRIASENEIEDKIEIKYKENNEKFTVDSDMTLDDIKEEMKIETADKIRYVLYIHIKPKTVKPSNVENRQILQVKPKNKKTKKDKDDDDQNKDSKEVKKPVQTKVQKPKETEFLFECQENKEKLKIKSDTTLKENEQEIRNLFEINKKVKIQYRTSIDDDSGGELIEDENSKIDKFKGKTIKIQCFTKKPPNYDDLIPGKTVYKYFYQTNKCLENVYEVELESNAIVKSMKKIIAHENDIQNLNDIKILFAGKDLMNDLVLKNLNIGTTILFVYIRSQEDILLMTAKALIVNTESEEESENEYSD